VSEGKPPALVVRELDHSATRPPSAITGKIYFFGLLGPETLPAKWDFLPGRLSTQGDQTAHPM
jgi:hypothetical protein